MVQGAFRCAGHPPDYAKNGKGHRPKDAKPLLKRDGGGWHSDRRPERAYTVASAKRVIGNMSERARDKQTALVARVQRVTGARISEAVKLRGDRIDVDRCRVTLTGKGGQTRTVQIDAKWKGFLKKMKARAESRKDGYVFQGRGSLRKRTEGVIRHACGRLGEKDLATHGFRKLWAQERYRELRAEGLSDLEARQALTQDLGHNRISETYSYVARGLA